MGFPTLLNQPTAAMPGQTTKTALTEEFMFQNVAYWPTVYRTGVLIKAVSHNYSERQFSQTHEHCFEIKRQPLKLEGAIMESQGFKVTFTVKKIDPWLELKNLEL